jgi:hypothetical protein
MSLNISVNRTTLWSEPNALIFCVGESDQVVDLLDVVRDRSDVDPIPEFDVNQDCYSW